MISRAFKIATDICILKGTEAFLHSDSDGSYRFLREVPFDIIACQSEIDEVSEVVLAIKGFYMERY